MLVKLLGTAAAEAIPALFCSCATCRESERLGGKNIRKRSSALVDGKIAVDFTNDMLSNAHTYGLNLSKLEHLFITHSHSDHFNYHDLEFRLKPFASSDNPVLNVYANEASVRLAKNFLKGWKDPGEYMNFHVLRPYTQVAVEGGYTVIPLRARHITEFPDEEALNYIIIHEGKTVFYGMDSGWYYDETWEVFRQYRFDLMVLDCTNGYLQFPVGNHMGFADNVKVVEKLMETGAVDEKSTIVSTHFSHNGRVVYDRDRGEFAESGLIMGYDGMEITV